jgi:glycosyltransferase involved in cell wall biosynthesis
MIPSLIEQLSHFNFADFALMFIDNASSDDSLHLTNSLIESNEQFQGVEFVLVQNEVNLGYGGSIQLAFQYAIQHDFHWLFIIHSDDQTDWLKALKTMSDMADFTDFDLILGSRFMHSNLTVSYNRLRLWGNKFFNIMTRLLTGVSLSDPGAAVGAFRLEPLKSIKISNLNTGYQFHPELNLCLAARRIKRLDFPLQWRDASSSDGLRILNYGVNLLRFLFRVFFQRVFKRKDLESAVYISSVRT